MNRSPRRITLRTAIAVALVGSSVIVAVIVTGVVVFTARNIIYESRQDSLLDEFTSTAAPLFGSISSNSPDDAWAYSADILPGQTAIIDLKSDRTVGELARSEVPPQLDLDDGRVSGPLTYLRATLRGKEVFFVSQVRDDLPDDPGARIALVTAYTMEPQRTQVLQLVGWGAAISGVSVAIIFVLERILGGALTRPLARLEDTARDVGAGRRPGTGSWAPSFADIDRVGDALRASSDALAKTIERLRQRESDSRRLVSNVAHELRTPLTSMMAVEEILDDGGNASAEDREIAVGIMRRGTVRLHNLTESLLELSRMDAGAAPIRLSTQPLAPLIVDIIESSGIAEVALECDGSIEITTDTERLHTVVANLLTNAARYGAPPIAVAVRADSDRVTLDVSDHGPGVNKLDAARIFDRFVTLDRSHSHGVSTGLGLAIALENARLLGGFLELAPTAVGAIFRLTLPRYGPDADQS